MMNRVGYSVLTEELTGYVRHTGQLADDLRRLAKRTVAAENSFGAIGKETGFATALDHYADALARQVGGISRNADRLSDGVAKTARGYRERDEQTAAEIVQLTT